MRMVEGTSQTQVNRPFPLDHSLLENIQIPLSLKYIPLDHIIMIGHVPLHHLPLDKFPPTGEWPVLSSVL